MLAPGDTRPAASYERLSKFRTRHGVTVARPVDRQHKDNLAAADFYGVTTVNRYTDEDRSASRFATRERERWAVLLDDVAGGRVSVVLLWVVDRVVRSTRDIDALLDACRIGGTVLVQSGSLTVVHPDDPDAVAMLKIGAVMAETEAAKTSMKVRRAMASMREDGRPHPGRRRFGYNPDMTVCEAEAAAVRDVAARLLAGESLYVLARDLEARGIRGTMGATLTGPNLRNLILRPHLAGYRTHKGEVIGDGDWTPVLDRNTYAAVHALLSEPSRRTSTRTARRYLLTGLAVCGECGRKLKARNQGTRGLEPAYVCETTSHVSRTMRRVDSIVAGAVAQVLAEVDGTGAPLRPEADDRAGAIRLELETLAGNLDALAVDKARGLITERAYAAAAAAVGEDTARLSAELADLAVAAAVPPAVLEDLTGHPVAACLTLFDGLPLGRQRAVIKALRLQVTVHKAHRGAAFNPALVTVERVA